MNSSFATKLKREFRLPTVREAFIILALVCATGTALALLQGMVRPVVAGRFALDSVSFPLALAPVERAGSYWNLIGWGYFLNDYRIHHLPWWIVEMTALFIAAVAFSRLLWWAPAVMLSGVVANMLEWHFTGQVLDWIIFPDGAQGVRALSLGDIGIYGGIVPCVMALTLMWIRLIRSWWFAIRDALRTARAQSPTPLHTHPNSAADRSGSA